MPLLEENEVTAEVERTTGGGAREPIAQQKYLRLEWLIPALLCTVMSGQLLLSSRQLSQTADEATHLYSGYRYLKCGDLSVSREHPPLAKVIAAAPLLTMNYAVDCTPFRGDALTQAFTSLNWLYSQNWPAALARARAAVSLFAVGLCLLVWIGARRMFGLTTAIVAGVLLIFEPNVLAYGSLVMTDIPVACMLLLAVLGFYLWVKHHTIAFFLLTGVATGLTLLTKHSGVVVIPILGVLAVLDALTQGDGGRSKWQLVFRNVLTVALICLLAAGVVWAGYGMRFAAQSSGPDARAARAPANSISSRVLFELEEHHLLPQAYLEGFATALTLSKQGSVAFVAGTVYSRAPWFCTPFNFLIRSTAAMQVMILAAAIGMVLAFGKRLRERLFLLIPVVIYLAVCIHASRNVSVRYLLPMFPFLVIAIADGCVELARRVRWMNYALPCLLMLHAASSLHAYPDYLSYASDFWGGPASAYRYLPWLDLGQAYPEAKAYLEQHPAESCWFITGWQWDPALYNVPCQASGLYMSRSIPPRVHGTIIVSSTLLADVRLPERELSAAFMNTVPTGHIGGSALLVYEGDFDTSLNAATNERNIAMSAFSGGQLSTALEHGQKAVDLAPASAIAHADLCIVQASSRLDLALKECSTARALLLHDPLREEESRKQYLDSLDLVLGALRSKYKSTYGNDPPSAFFEDTPRQ